MPSYYNGSKYIISYGLMYVSSYLKNKGFNVSAINLNHYGPAKLAEILNSEKFDVIGTGGLFVFYNLFEKTVNTIRTHSPDSKIILGGPLVSAHPEFILEALKPDFLVLGEGEETTANLLRSIEDNLDPNTVKGIAFYENGKFVKTPAAPLIENLDEIPFPDFEGFEFDTYLREFPPQKEHHTINKHKNRRLAPLITGRDCPAKCTFCYRMTGGRLRQRSLDNVMREITHLIDNYHVNELEIWDDLFASSKERLISFCERVKPLDINWGCQLRVTNVDAEMLAKMKESGCNIISYGIESASNSVLKSMKKGVRIEQIEKTLHLTREAKITITGNFIFGDPSESRETVEETLRFYRKNKHTFSNSIALTILLPYPGTVLYYNLLNKGRIKNLELFYITTRDEKNQYINMTSLSDKEFKYLIDKRLPLEEKRNRLYGAVFNSRKISKNRYSFSVICPLCKEKSDNVNILLNPDENYGVNFRLACPQCLQRFYMKDIQLLGTVNYVLYYSVRIKFVLWKKFLASRLFAIVRNSPLFFPIIRPLWEQYKLLKSKKLT